PRALSLVPQVFRVAIALGLYPGVLEVLLLREWALEPIQKLGGRIDLVVVLAVWKDRDLVEVFGEPGSILRDTDKAVLDQCSLRMQPHDRVGCRLVTGDAIAAIGDQLL